MMIVCLDRNVQLTQWCLRQYAAGVCGWRDGLVAVGFMVHTYRASAETGTDVYN